MKFLKYFALTLMMLVFQTGAQAQSSDLDVFLGKLKAYAGRHRANHTWTMPVIKPDNKQARMPSPTIIGYMEDPETGLRYSPKSGLIYDPETSFAFDIRTGEIYKGKSEIKLGKPEKI
ncbi:hypothetical protein I2I11_06960 [Pontibacter sp. 172403-2]|uniref:hypothetical protein n=1 Tax=Pontibacter rufus TaxID=2791028 RepID=UPI0018B01403|nr:hypothetical protein [Pontibacter sp. 172403-2]MBF9253025.1 hypothetical protein [Pontibacter sp. 172403-2]